MLDVVFEVLNDSSVGVELHHKRRVVVLRDIDTSEAQEVIFSAVIVVLHTLIHT
jgi:hypothetical protein